MSSRAQGEKGSQGATGGSETAARTRPLSIQEILRRREKKAVAEAKRAAAEAKDTKGELQDYEKGKPSRSDSGRGHRARKDVPVEKESVRDAPREDSRKDDVRHASKEGSRKDSARHAPREASKKDSLKDRPKDGSKVDDAPKKGSKKERPSARDDGQSAAKDKGSRSSHKLSASTRGRPAESRDGTHGEIRARNGDAARSEYLKGPAKRWNGEPVHSDRIIESDKLRNEAKRKYDHRRPEYDQRRPDVDLPVLKKHDSARFRHYDRNDGRKEYGNPYHEEPRPKRRRSRSRDHDQGRRGRSVSLSPKAQRRSYHGHDRDNYPPGRKYAENDRHRTSGNGGHGGESYQRHESPLGGYSPRKRKTVPQDEQVSTKITPPAVRSPEKKPATWDQAPAGADQSNFFTTLKPIVSQTSSVSVSSSAPKPTPAIETILSGNSSSIDSVQLTQATRPLRRLHIENLTSSASEDMLIGCLNDFLLSSGGNHIQRSKQPCLSCTINKEKRHAFVEFLTPEDATAALSFDGKSFNGSTLKIRRPKDYIEMPHVAPKKPVEEEIKVTSDVVADSPHKIFIAGISGVLSSEMLMEIVSSFGQLAAYRFVCNEDLGRRCAFLEYIDHSITNKACAGLNGMKLGGSIITAVQVFPNPLEVHNEASPFYGIPYSAEALLEEPTKVLQLKNVVDREEYLLLSKPELEEILEDVRMECARFGAVKSINIVEYPSSIDSITEDIVVEPKDGPAKLEPTECCANDNCAETATDCPLPSKSIAVPSGPMKITGVDPISEGQDHKEPDTLCESDIPAAADQYTDLDDLHAGAAGPSLDQQMEAVHMDSAQADQDATAVGDIHARASGLSTDQPTEAVNMGFMQSDQDGTAVSDIHAGTVGPTLDQQTEADHMDSMQADQDGTAVGDIHATAADPTLDQQTEADHMDSTQADHHATALDDDSAVGEGHAGSKTLEICISTATPGDVVQRSETENEQKSSNDVSESGAEKIPAAVSDTIVLEAGSILVEFMRKEAACMAAHSLHGRSFGDRTVSTGYAPHDLYLQRYWR
ncbi:uncharacterized protein LOC124701400 [Lolium rigidum]|uniref:uncharacterized protein LOC124701400 n=1 Tax=Lolium rigidum TaxID=89674 RepID=UPI001F5C1089|nr:uncharacterized protein LOC124701400 [Lolium rigidum]